MANKKITELTALASPASDDVLAIVDVSGTAETKKITVANLTAGASGLLTQVTTTIANAAVLTMKYNNTPITIVAAEAGKIIVPVSFVIVGVHAGANETSSDNLLLGWDAATSGSGDYISSITDWMNGVSSGTQSMAVAPSGTRSLSAFPASAVNEPLQAWCNDVFNGGWSMTIYTTYFTITV
tara:strand:+ start:5 stop:553 length:549 start_codon:yes stop_codon:yes gene_type:complete